MKAIGALPLVTSLLALILATRTPSFETSREAASSLRRAQATRILRAGYAAFRPYTIVEVNEPDPEKRVSGFAADLIREIASRQSPSWKVEWHKVSWESLKGDMSSGRFDVLVDPVYQTLPRAGEFLMSEPYSYFGVAAGLVRRGENRFREIGELDHSQFRIALAEGWTSTDYARTHLSHATLAIVPIGDDPYLQFHEVLSGRADIALQDVPSVLQFVRAHPREVEARWTAHPPMKVAGGFLLRRGDFEMKAFLDVAIRALELEGRIAELDRKWNAFGELREAGMRPGTGLRE